MSKKGLAGNVGACNFDHQTSALWPHGMHFAPIDLQAQRRSILKRAGVQIQDMGTHLPTTGLRVRALAALEKSTKLIEVALDLLKQGNVTEAARLKNQARAQRNLSVRLFALANGAELPTRDRSTYLRDS